jgi:hypothetical protein
VNQIRKRLTYANVMSSIAVFLVLGGAAFAAVQLPKNSVGSKQLKKNAVNSGKVKDGSLKATDFGAGQLPAGPAGPQGPQGPKGAQGTEGPEGPEGTALGYARVDSDGTLDPATSKGVISATTAGSSLICFELDFAPKSVVATIEAYASDHTNFEYGTIVSGLGVGVSACPAGTDAYIATSNLSGGSVRYPVFVVFN